MASPLTVASFFVIRRHEFPKVDPADYVAMLLVLQRSCDRLGFRHVVLTDLGTVASPLWPDGLDPWIGDDVPLPLMQACTHLQAQVLDRDPASDILFVGADSILLADPQPHLPGDADLYVTSRRPSGRLDAINNGFMFIRNRAREQAAALYRRVADRCGTAWMDDQKALVAELAPVPMPTVIEERAGLRVGFLPMRRFNHWPHWRGDPCKDAILLHFKGRTGKKLMPEWARKHGLA